MILARWMRGSHLPLLILLGPVLLAAGCATEAGPVSPTPGSDSTSRDGSGFFCSRVRVVHRGGECFSHFGTGGGRRRNGANPDGRPKPGGASAG